MCDGAGRCAPPTSTPCSTSSECPSGFCVDGVCCDTACGGRCVACSAAKKGWGDDGTCDRIACANPDGECAGDLVCIGNGTCGTVCLF
ncbi:hypothetical protein [Sorangium sp. So ce513]|uniref:hypothetical protein n=1 Tax=Sorangium sp. So ce513 TaxID=3133315 RepID=UPI003F642CF8